jgi:hypothetical protein
MTTALLNYPLVIESNATTPSETRRRWTIDAVHGAHPELPAGKHDQNTQLAADRHDEHLATESIAGSQTSGELEPTVADEVASASAFLPTRAALGLIETVLMLSKSQLLDPAIDVIFKWVSDLLYREDFGACNQLLLLVLWNSQKIDDTLLVSFLVITLAAKPKIPLRSDLYAETERILIQKYGESRTRKVLKGLE